MLDDLVINELSGKFIIGLLFFIRISGIVVASPIFRSPAIPIPVKIFITAILSFMLTSAFANEVSSIDFHLWNIALLSFKEFLTGAIIGYALDLILQAGRYAGGMIDFEMGYHTSALFDIESTTPSIVGELKSSIILMLFLFLNGHHFVIESLYASVRAVPINSFVITESSFILLIKLITTVSIIAVKMAAPVLVSIFLTNMALALLAKIAPQTNIFILSFTLKITVGLLIMMISIPLMVMLAKYGLTLFQNETLKLIMSLNPARV